MLRARAGARYHARVGACYRTRCWCHARSCTGRFPPREGQEGERLDRVRGGISRQCDQEDVRRASPKDSSVDWRQLYRATMAKGLAEGRKTQSLTAKYSHMIGIVAIPPTRDETRPLATRTGPTNRICGKGGLKGLRRKGMWRSWRVGRRTLGPLPYGPTKIWPTLFCL